MSQEPTAPTPPEGQEPEESANGQEPTPAGSDESKKAKTYDEGYIRQLRREAASSRTELAEARTELSKLKDRDKSETERLTERVAESDRRAGEAETRLLRYEVAAQRGLDLEAANRLAGSTREEFEANADWMAQQFSDKKKSPGFDGGARQTPEAIKKPDEAHNDLLLRALGRQPAD